MQISFNILKKVNAKKSIAFDTYWKFCSERQAVYTKRVLNEPAPWTKDPIINQYKFTNVYRASDRVSQYLIKNVIYQGNQSSNEIVFRVLLFKIFNKIETWEYLQSNLGEISYKNFNLKKFNNLLTNLYNSDQTVYSAAYIMPSGGKYNKFPYKHEMHLNLLKNMMNDGLPLKLENSKSMKEAYEIICSYPTIGNFLGYQYVTDINYSRVTNFSEKDFVVPGPGALDGISKCFTSLGNYSPEDIIRYMCDTAEEHFDRLKIDFQDLWGRPLQLIDCQNIFCEVSKYTRISHPQIEGLSGRTRIKQNYKQTAKIPSPWFPPKWNINTNIEKYLIKNSQ